MSLKDWFAAKRNKKSQSVQVDARVCDEELCKLWVKCYNCASSLISSDLEKNNLVCPNCDYHFRVNAKTRITQLFDKDTFEEINGNISSDDPLNFVDTEDYKSRQAKAKKKTGLNDAVITGIGEIDGQKLAAAVMDFEFMGGSMGSVVGEKVTRLIEKATEDRIPIIVATSSGGARMQESVLSLMQMAKTSCAVARANEEKILYMTLLTEPTFGGVTASFGTLGDIIIAEQGARIGFAGRRVIEQTIRQKLPADFQTAESLMKHGQVDIISHRNNLKGTISNLIRLHNLSVKTPMKSSKGKAKKASSKA